MTAIHSIPSDTQFPHPLEIVPALRRIPQSLLRDAVYTLLLSAITTAVFTAIMAFNMPAASLQKILFACSVLSLCIGYSIHLTTQLASLSIRHWLPNISSGQRALCGLLAAAFGASFGYWLGTHLFGVNFRFGSVIVILWAGSTLSGIAISQRRLMRSELAVAHERGARIEAQRLMTLARLQTLQAQIEPHFLFNTLANVSSLIDVEPKQARRMLDQLSLLLRASLDQTRKTTTPLRVELQVIDAYLSMLKVRMGERLSYTVEAPPELQNIEVPSMLLQPIVENAVKHGIEPRMTGGVVQVKVRRLAESLQFVVTDDGVGFVANGKENIGLGAVRERLAAQYGDVASLKIERTPENLTCVTIQIPFPSVMPS